MYNFEINHFGSVWRNASINMICAGVREGGKDECGVRIIYNLLLLLYNNILS